MDCYAAFGLLIHSELKLPELAPTIKQVTASDVSIKLCDVDPAHLKPDVFLIDSPDVAKYFISDGRDILIKAYPSPDETTLRMVLLSSVLSILLVQRGLLLLHANAIKVGQHCISFAGNKGLGKSSLAGAFIKKGYHFLADDLCAIDDSNYIYPSFPHVKLWHDSTKALGISTKAHQKIRPDANKYVVPVHGKFHAYPLPIKIVYVLDQHEKSEITIVELKGVRKVRALAQNTYRYQYLNGLNKLPDHLEHCTNLASKIDVVQLTRPNKGFMLDELVDFIERDLSARNLL